MKQVVRMGAIAAFGGYLALGLVSWPDKGPRAALPMADWSVPRIETENVRALHVSGAVRAPQTRAAQTPTPQTSMPQRALPDLRPLEPYDSYAVGTRAVGACA